MGAWKLQKPGGNHAKMHDSRLAYVDVYLPIVEYHLTVDVVYLLWTTTVVGKCYYPH